jgi:hypothetical protein
VVGWGNLKSDSLDLIDWNIDWHGVSFKVILGMGLNETAGCWSVSVGSVSVSLHEAFSVWLRVLVVVSLSLLVSVVLSMLVTLNYQ